MSLLRKGGGSSSLKFDTKAGKNSRLFKKFKGFIRSFSLLDGADSVLVALSGGPDSVCLLNLLFLFSTERNISLYAAHFHHGLRGREADRDADFSKRLCKENGIEFFAGKGDVYCLSKRQRIGIQDAARRLRYDFLREMAQKKHIDLIATGHTADDQAEELILRFIRGASLEGLGGIRPRREDGIIRPILFAEKREILGHLKEMGIPFVVDSSNLEGKYTRNRVRHLLVPIIKENFNPSISKCLARTALMLQDDEEVLVDLSKIAFEKARECQPLFRRFKQTLILSIPTLCKEPDSILRRILFLALKAVGVPRDKVVSDHILKMAHLVRSPNPSSCYRLPDNFIAIRIYHHFVVSRDLIELLERQKANELSRTIDGTGQMDMDEVLGQLCIRMSKVNPSCLKDLRADRQSYPRPIFLGLDNGLFPLNVRVRKPGDRFRPLGAKNPLKLKDFLISRGIPRLVRDSIPLLVKDGEIAGICGIEVAHPFRVKTDEAIEVTWKPHVLLRGLFSLVKTRVKTG